MRTSIWLSAVIAAVICGLITAATGGTAIQVVAFSVACGLVSLTISVVVTWAVRSARSA